MVIACISECLSDERWRYGMGDLKTCTVIRRRLIEFVSLILDFYFPLRSSICLGHVGEFFWPELSLAAYPPALFRKESLCCFRKYYHQIKLINVRRGG